MSTGRIRRSRKFQVGLCAAALSRALPLLLVFQFALPGLALCLEPGGTANIEEYSNGSCGETFEPAHDHGVHERDLHAADCSHGGHCGECLDIPLPEAVSGKNALSRTGADREMSLQTLAAAVMQPMPRLHVYATSRRAVTAPLKSVTPLSVKTTVLIC